WRATAEVSGVAHLELRARAGEYSDGMSASCPILEHGIETTITRSGRAQGDDVRLRFDLPKARRPDSATLTVQVTPSLAVTMLDALPYLLDYPYGCVEQTMSRFLPAVIVQKTLADLGLKPEAVADRIFGGIEAATADKTHPQGPQNMQRLAAIVNGGLTRLYDFQHADGAWAWWKDGDSDRFMTAYVVYGLALARQAGVAIKSGVVERGAAWLDKELVLEEANPDLQAWMLQALGEWQLATGAKRPSAFQNKALDNLWSQRDRLNGCTRALATLAAKRFGRSDQARVYADNLRNGVQVDEQPDQSIVQTGVPQSRPGQGYAVTATAHWGEDGIAWRWSDGGVEATANALRALLAVDPHHPLVAPTVQWLVKNRRGAQWSNTRDTALVVLALNDYLRASGELGTHETYELQVNGQSVAKKTITPETILGAPGRFEIAATLLRDGANEVRILRNGATNGALYVSACASFFSLEEPIPAAASELFLQRQYYHFVGRPSLLKGWVYKREPLLDQGVVTSGERIETVLTLEVKNNAEYLILEDLKPAGIEAVAVRSGESLYAKELTKDGARRAPDRRENGDYTGRTRWVYQELRDRKVAMFIDKLPQGVWELRCEMRAETPGRYHGLPAMGQAMYVPEIRAHTAEQRLAVEDRPDTTP
ncbi:MAG: alpha-2-macroglobulin, partial [Kiritimatiellia bacterium]